MGNVIISPNVKRTSERIDPGGNVIDPRTKQIIQPVVPEYVPPVADEVPLQDLPTSTATPSISKIDEMINKKIEDMVARKIEEAFSKL